MELFYYISYCTFHLLTNDSVLDAPTLFKHIPSPVGLYIKHSPSVPLKKKHVPKAATQNKLCGEQKCDSNKENIDDFDLPYVSYKPAKNREILEEIKTYHLPKSIEKMMPPEPLIERHDVRTKSSVEDHGSVRRKLEMADLTTSMSDSSLFESSSRAQDLSVVTIKHTYK